MPDRDLATLHEVETKHLNEAVKRNPRRFPPDFMFQLAKAEFEEFRFKMETPDNSNILKPKITNLKVTAFL